MDARTDSRRAIAELEQLSGFQVFVTADPTLRVLATIKLAKTAAPGHILRYNPAASATLDYLITFQCEFARRLYEAPAESRFEFGQSDSARYKIEKLIRTSPAGKLPVAQNAAFRSQLLDGLLTHLRSAPLGLRVDRKITRSYPSLLAQQKSSAERQLRENLQSLEPGIRQIMPSKVLEATTGINAAIAIFWADQWEQPEQLVPYKAVGVYQIGRDLLKILDTITDSGQFDAELIDAWADRLGLVGWHRWIPYIT